MYTVNLINRIWKIRKVLSCYDNIVIVCILYLPCKVIGFDDCVLLVDENDTVADAVQNGFPVRVVNGKTSFITGYLDT